MKIISLKLAVAGLAALLAGASLPKSASAQVAPGYPSRPITLIVPVAAGGLTDALGRIVAADLGAELNGTVIVENRVGAGGTTGMMAAARAEPDGYTIILAFQGPATVAPSLYRNLKYDTLRDFTGIGMIGKFDNVLAVSAKTDFKDVPSLIAYAKQNPGKLTYSSAGVGSTSHLAAELFMHSAGIELTHVPYRGEAPALTDLAAGSVLLMFGTLSTTQPLTEGNRIRMLALCGLTKSPLRPDLPLIADIALPKFEVVGWYGLLAPAKTPPAILAALRDALAKTLNNPETVKRMEQIGIQKDEMTLAQFQEWLRSDTDKWKDVIIRSKIQVQ